MEVGLHQGSAVSPFLFITLMDILGSEASSGPPWTLLFADDLALMVKTCQTLQDPLEEWYNVFEGNWLKISRKKTVYMGPESLELQGEAMPKEENFKYLGSTINMSDNLKPKSLPE